MVKQIEDAMGEAPDERHITYLRRLVTVLTTVMIGGFLVIVALIVIRFSGSDAVALPDEILLPDGTRAIAVTYGPEWYAVVTADDEILIYSRNSGRLTQQIPIDISD